VLVSVWISEFNFNEWGTSARVMMDGLDDTLKVPINRTLDEVSANFSGDSYPFLSA